MNKLHLKTYLSLEAIVSITMQAIYQITTNQLKIEEDSYTQLKYKIQDVSQRLNNVHLH